MIATFTLFGVYGCQPGAVGFGSSNVTSSHVTAGDQQSSATGEKQRDGSKVQRSKTEKGKVTKSKDGKKKDMNEKSEKFELSDKEWRERLSREQYRVLRQKGTERPFRNKYDKHFAEGTYVCAGCGQELFTSKTKFNSGCGWPAFYAAKAKDRVKLTPDYSLGMIRTEVTCARCDGHLGHIFDDAPQTPTGQRYCINSVSLKFIPAKKEKK
jgi:peptide-methionine (R)-S-oxide reductase